METGSLPSMVVDHVDGDVLNNRFSNLRDVSVQENARNQGVGVRNTSGVIGVHWNSRIGKWAARIKVNGVVNHLGFYSEMKDAVEARKAAESIFGFHPNTGNRPSLGVGNKDRQTNSEDRVLVVEDWPFYVIDFGKTVLNDKTHKRGRGRPRTITDMKVYKAMKQREYRARKK